MRARNVIGLAVAAVSLALLDGVPAGAGNSRRPDVICRSTYPPNVGDGRNSLDAVTATSARNAWAVGSYFNALSTRGHSLIERWDGTTWSVQPSPSPGDFDDLVAVTATSTRDAWALGDYSYAGGPDQPVMEHWDGVAWKAQAIPSEWTLESIVATSPASAWAVGSISDQPLIAHWDGRAWKVAPSPDLGDVGGGLLGVAALSPGNAWAVGYSGASALIEHWNGRAWRLTRVPQPTIRGFNGALGAQLYGVAVTSASNAWAAGYADASVTASGGEYSQTLIERWNGRAWHIQRSPNPGGGILGLGTNQLFSVAAMSGAHAWAVGGFVNGVTLERWNGAAWKARASLPPPPGDATLFGVSARLPATVWAVGNAGAANLALSCH